MKKKKLLQIGMKREFSNWIREVESNRSGDISVGKRIVLLKDPLSPLKIGDVGTVVSTDISNKTGPMISISFDRISDEVWTLYNRPNRFRLL